MKKLILTSLLLASSITYANTCSDGTCPNYPVNDNEVWAQDQSNSITNANTAVMQQQMYLSSPIGSIPVNSVGKDGASCSQSFNYVSAGASKARLSGVNNNAFGNGSWAAGVQVGRVFTDSDDNCKGYQEVMKKSAEFSLDVETNMHCLRSFNTYKDAGLNPLQTLLNSPRGNLVRKTCQPMFELWQSDLHQKMVVEANLKSTQKALSQPQYRVVKEKVKVGYNEYRIRFLDYVAGCKTGCNDSLGVNSLQEYLNNIKKFLPEGAKLYTVPYKNQTRISVFVRNNYYKESEAYETQQHFIQQGFVTWILGVDGAEKWKVVEKKVML